MSRSLPTPFEVLQGLLLVLIMVPSVQYGLMFIGILIALFHHWIIGGIIAVIGFIANIIWRQFSF